jgi:hypothetical protein
MSLNSRRQFKTIQNTFNLQLLPDEAHTYIWQLFVHKNSQSLCSFNWSSLTSSIIHTYNFYNPTHTQKKGTISRLEYIREIQISEILQHIQEIQISQVSKCSSLWIPLLFQYTHNKYWTKNKTSTATLKNKKKWFEAKCQVIEVSHWSQEIALELLHIMHISLLYCQYESECKGPTPCGWKKKTASVMSSNDSCLNNAKLSLMQQLTL